MKARLPHNSKKHRAFQLAILASLTVLVGMAIPPVFSAAGAAIMYPVHVVNQWLRESTSLIPTFIRDRQSFVQQIHELENKLIIANGSEVTERSLLEENVRLRKLLGAESESRILAAVIARPSELPHDMLQIDRGSKDGIEVGAPVFIGRDSVVGLVVHTAPDYSFVELFTTDSFETTVFISGPNVIAVMEGVGGGVARVRVPQGIPLLAGNLVYLPSIEPGVFGRISHVENGPTQPEQYGYITPELPIASLYQVSVGKQSQITRSVSEIDKHVLDIMQTELLVGGIEVGQVGTTSSTSSTSATSSSSL